MAARSASFYLRHRLRRVGFPVVKPTRLCSDTNASLLASHPDITRRGQKWRGGGLRRSLAGSPRGRIVLIVIIITRLYFLPGKTESEDREKKQQLATLSTRITLRCSATVPNPHRAFNSSYALLFFAMLFLDRFSGRNNEFRSCFWVYLPFSFIVRSFSFSRSEGVEENRRVEIVVVTDYHRQVSVL